MISSINNNTENKSKLLIETLKESIQKGELVKIKLGGNSMWPFIKNGTNATIKRVEIEELKIGDIIVFSTGNKIIAHRIINLNESSKEITTKGDNRFFSDKKIGSSEYIGKIIFLETGNKKINTQLKSNYSARLSYILTPFYRISFKLAKLFS